MSNTNGFPTVQYSHIQKSTLKEVLPQVFAVCVKNLLFFTHALTLAYPTILIPGVSGRDPNEKIRLDADAISWISPIHQVSVSVGCVLTGPLTQRFGRKLCMQLITIPFLMGWMILYFSKETWHIFFALFILGIAGGLSEGPVITYVAEISQPHLRGTLTSLSTVSIQFGMLTQFIVGTAVSWRNAALVSSLMPIISFFALLIIPESHMWLMTKNRPEEARKSLAWLRRWTNEEIVEKEFSDLKNHIINERERENSRRILDSIFFLKKKENFLPFSLMALIFALSSFSGILFITTYAIPIFSTLKTPIDAYYATVILGITQLLGTTVCMSFIKILGKRILTFFSLFGLGVCLLIVAFCIHAYDILDLEYTLTQDTTEHWIPAIIIFIASFSAFAGIIILPWNLQGEVFSGKDRATAVGLISATGYFIESAARKFFPKMITFITLPGVFLLFSLVAFSGIPLLYFLLPETEGKTLYEISDHYRGIKRLSNKVERKNEISVNSDINNY